MSKWDFRRKPSQSSEFPKKKRRKKQSHEPINQNEALNYKKGEVQKHKRKLARRKKSEEKVNQKKVELNK